MKKYLVIFAGIALIFGVLVVFNFVKGQEATTTQNQATTTQSQSPTIQPSTTTPISTPPTVPPVLSPNPSSTRPLIPNISEIKEELRQELSIKEIRGRVVCQAIGVCPKAGENTEVLIKSAKVEEIGADYLKISIFGYQYKVDLVNAKIVRYGWLESHINEFSVGDIVNVWGFLDEGDKYLIHAKNVRNISIQKVHNVFRGVKEERKIEGKAKGMNVKIEELQKKLLEILEKLKTATSTSQ